jgi:hypothetical protein
MTLAPVTQIDTTAITLTITTFAFFKLLINKYIV